LWLEHWRGNKSARHSATTQNRDFALGDLFDGALGFIERLKHQEFTLRPSERTTIPGMYRYGVATYSQNGGENFSYRTVSGKNQLETFGVGPGELHITVNRMDGKSVIHAVDCAEEQPEPNPNTVWRSRHYSSGNPNLTCHDKADVVVTVSSM
jgi:hypothetical protein